MIGFSDERPFSVETAHGVLTGLFGWSSAFVSSGAYSDLVIRQII